MLLLNIYKNAIISFVLLFLRLICLYFCSPFYLAIVIVLYPNFRRSHLSPLTFLSGIAAHFSICRCLFFAFPWLPLLRFFLVLEARVSFAPSYLVFPSAAIRSVLVLFIGLGFGFLVCLLLVLALKIRQLLSSSFGDG